MRTLFGGDAIGRVHRITAETAGKEAVKPFPGVVVQWAEGPSTPPHIGRPPGEHRHDRAGSLDHDSGGIVKVQPPYHLGRGMASRLGLPVVTALEAAVASVWRLGQNSDTRTRDDPAFLSSFFHFSAPIRIETALSHSAWCELLRHLRGYLGSICIPRPWRGPGCFATCLVACGIICSSRPPGAMQVAAPPGRWPPALFSFRALGAVRVDLGWWNR